jgi:hypothetical protein
MGSRALRLKNDATTPGAFQKRITPRETEAANFC